MFCSISLSFVKAQFSCSGAFVIANGFTANGVTTAGGGANSWVTSAQACTGGVTNPPVPLINGTPFTTTGDDYVYKYTTGSVAGETAVFEINTRTTYTGLLAFTSCNGTVLSGCVQGAASSFYGGTSSNPFHMKVTAANLPANTDIYFAIGTTNSNMALNFDVTNFTVTGGSLATNEVATKADQLNVYPNPVKDFLSINNLKSNSNVTVVDMSGKEVINTTLKKDEKLNVSSLEKGVYIVTVGTKDEKKSYRIVKD